MWLVELMLIVFYFAKIVNPHWTKLDFMKCTFTDIWRFLQNCLSKYLRKWIFENKVADLYSTWGERNTSQSQIKGGTLQAVPYYT